VRVTSAAVGAEVIVGAGGAFGKTAGGVCSGATAAGRGAESQLAASVPSRIATNTSTRRTIGSLPQQHEEAARGRLLRVVGAGGLFYAAARAAERAALACSATAAKAAGSRTAISASALRLSSMPALFRPSMSWP
jgi:hypothetical protein